jgi:hypothetical protein
MKLKNIKFISSTVILLLFNLSCNNTNAVINPIKIVNNNPIKLSFSIKNTETMSRIKSIDAYLIKNYNDPLNSTSNAYSNGFKYQSNITSDSIDISFTGYPADQTVYVAIQAFDNTIEGLPRNNITAYDESITLGDKQVARSSNSAIFTSNNLTFSNSSTALNIDLKLIPYNSVPINITPESGSDTVTGSIGLR